MNKELSKKAIKHNKHQEVIFVGSRLFDVIEHISFWLHIIALILGISTITGLVTSVNSHFEHTLEIITMIVITLIIFEFLFVPTLEKIIMKKMLRDLWGTNKIATSVRYPTSIDLTKQIGYVNKFVEFTHINSTLINWVRSSIFKRRKLLVYQSSKVTSKKFKKYLNENNEIDFFFIPIYIIVDVKNKEIKFQGRINFVNSKMESEIKEKRLTFEIDLNKKKLTWSGIFPDFPAYGEWIWDLNLSKKILENEDKEKKINNAVKKEFKKK